MLPSVSGGQPLKKWLARNYGGRSEDVGNWGANYNKLLATARNGELGGRAGPNPLQLTRFSVVSHDHLEVLQEMAEAVYGERHNAAITAPSGAPRFRFFEEWFEAGSEPGVLRYEMNPTDTEEILASIRSGKIYADFLIATIHTHQGPSYCGQCVSGIARSVTAGVGMREGVDDHRVPDFLIELAHDSIDNGADMFVAHGQHTLRGVEIYNGKPIFYGLSNFVFQFGLQPGASYDVMANYDRMAQLEYAPTQDAVLTTSRFEKGMLAEVRLYPVDLGGSRRPISQMGIPLPPSSEDARRILTALQEYSRPFGTHISIENGVGVIRIQ